MKKILIVLASLALLGLAVSGYLLIKPSDNATQGPTSSEDLTTSAEENTPASASFSGKNSLTYLLGLTQDLECTIEFTDQTASTTVTGSYFTSQGRLRGDFTMPEPDNGTVSSMILRDTTLYTWTIVAGEGYGMKIDLAKRAEAKVSETAPDTNEPVPLDAPVTYSCKPWTAKDDSIFELPDEVVFKDYAELMNQGMEYGTVYEEGPVGPAGSPCALCDQVAPGEGQDECRARFQCQ